MTVLDTSGIIDFLIGEEAAGNVAALLAEEGTVAVPDLLVFEVVAVFRRLVQRGAMAVDRAAAAIDDLGDVPMELFPTLPLRERAFALRDNLTAADAFFVALAESLGEPLATKDRVLATVARDHVGIRVIELSGPR